ncbi:MAG: hypothetical protein RL385_1773 [Pseudomonadota bacterium]|jgi:hypothetical protein
MKVRAGLASAFALVFVLGATSDVAAHPLSPAVLSLDESAPGRYAVEFRRGLGLRNLLTPVLPRHCAKGPARDEISADQIVSRFDAECGGSLRGESLRVEGLVASELSALVNVRFLQGDPVRGVISPRATSLALPRQSTSVEAFVAFARLGMGHLAEGPDHLLFVAGLLFVCTGLGPTLRALTGFTLAHSVTLALSVLHVLPISPRVAELGIALSIVALSLRLLDDLRSHGATSARMTPTGFAVASGLVHGLGFANALKSTGLPSDARALCLAAFNLGLEVAQVAWVLVLALLLAALVRVRSSVHGIAHPSALRAPLQRWLAYAIGTIGVLWCIERLPF